MQAMLLAATKAVVQARTLTKANEAGPGESLEVGLTLVVELQISAATQVEHVARLRFVGAVSNHIPNDRFIQPLLRCGLRCGIRFGHQLFCVNHDHLRSLLSESAATAVALVVQPEACISAQDPRPHVHLPLNCSNLKAFSRESLLDLRVGPCARVREREELPWLSCELHDVLLRRAGCLRNLPTPALQLGRIRCKPPNRKWRGLVAMLRSRRAACRSWSAER